MLLTSKELKGMNIDIRVDKMFSLKPDLKNELNGKSIVLGAYVDKKAVSLKSTIEILDLPVFSKVYSEFKELEKNTTGKTKDIKLAIIRKNLLAMEKFNDGISQGYIELLCNGKKLSDFKIYKHTLYKAIITFGKELKLDIIQSEYAENGMLKSELVIDSFKTSKLAFELIDSKENIRGIFEMLETSTKVFKDTLGIKKAIKELPTELENLPNKIKDELEKFIQLQVKTKIDDIEKEYSDLFDN